jgi:hypothetical protein
LFRTKGEVILIYLSKRKEKLRFGGKRVPRLNTEGYWSSLLSRLILPEAVLEYWKQGVTFTFKPWEP